MTKRLLLLNGIAAILVVVNHTAYYGFIAMFNWADRYRGVAVPNFDQVGSVSYYVLFIAHQVAEMAIPAFLFVSGFFIAFAARASRSGLTWEMVWSRSRKLIPPFLIWTTIFTTINYFSPLEVTINIRYLLERYYYIPLIIQLYFLSPLLVRLVKRNWLLALLITAMIQFGTQALRHTVYLGLDFPGRNLLIDLTPVWFFPGHIFYFTIGVVAGTYLQQFSQVIVRFRWILLAAAIAFLTLTIIEYELIATIAGKNWLGYAFSGISRNLYAVFAVLAFLAFDKVRLPYPEKLSELGTKSLGIYLLNMPAMHLVALFFYWVVPWILGVQLLLQPILFITGLGVPLIIMNLFNRPRTRVAYHYLFG
jgi:fucose 4-O-acetylase-like acetyltransferase